MSISLRNSRALSVVSLLTALKATHLVTVEKNLRSHQAKLRRLEKVELLKQNLSLPCLRLMRTISSPHTNKTSKLMLLHNSNSRPLLMAQRRINKRVGLLKLRREPRMLKLSTPLTRFEALYNKSKLSNLPQAPLSQLSNQPIKIHLGRTLREAP
jgi:hypothetical protein